MRERAHLGINEEQDVHCVLTVPHPAPSAAIAGRPPRRACDLIRCLQLHGAHVCASPCAVPNVARAVFFVAPPGRADNVVGSVQTVLNVRVLLSSSLKRKDPEWRCNLVCLRRRTSSRCSGAPRTLYWSAQALPSEAPGRLATTVWAHKSFCPLSLCGIAGCSQSHGRLLKINLPATARATEKTSGKPDPLNGIAID